MNSKRMVKLSNTIGLVAVLALVYWVLIFVTTEVFRLKIFAETVTQIFNWGIIGILVLMFGALIINIMFNLSRIADKINNDVETAVKRPAAGIIVFIASLPLLIICLFLGNHLSTKKLENELKNSADAIINSYRKEINKISNYTFDKEWINDTMNLLSLMLRLDHNLNNMAIIVEDEIDGSPFYLTFYNGRQIGERDTLNKIEYIRKYDLDERDYIEKVFKQNYSQKYFQSNKGSYHLFIPYEGGNRKIILFFSDLRAYGSLKSL